MWSKYFWKFPGLNLQHLPHDTFDDEMDEGNFSNEKTLHLYLQMRTKG